MNKIEFSVERIGDLESVIIDRIEFRNAAFVKLFIDGSPIDVYGVPDDGLVVYSEVVKTLLGSGVYLIFTSASGIADDGGWEGVDVKIENKVVSWDFTMDDKNYHFEFGEQQYRSAIQILEKDIANVPDNIALEPTDIFFPESWD